jgi:hypothetical protein
MSDPVPAPVSVEASATGVVEAVPAPPPVSSVVPAAVVDFANKSELLKFVLKTIAEVEILADRSDEDKAKFIIAEVKKAIHESPLPEDKKQDLDMWCDLSLPYVIDAVKLVKAEAGKVVGVALAEVKKCCPSFFSKKA